MDHDHESIPLEDKIPESAPVAPAIPIEDAGKLNEALNILQEALPTVRGWMADVHEWELLEPAAGDVLAFAHRSQPCLHRVAGHLRASADVVIARLKDHTPETRLAWDPDVEHVECLNSFGDNVERVRSVVRMPMRMASVTLEGIQHTTYMEDSRTYFYLFASLPPSGGAGQPDAEAVVGITVRELDKDTGCEVNAVFQCAWHTHWSVAWLVDPMLMAHFFNAERMMERAHLYEKK